MLFPFARRLSGHRFPPKGRALLGPYRPLWCQFGNIESRRNRQPIDYKRHSSLSPTKPPLAPEKRRLEIIAKKPPTERHREKWETVRNRQSAIEKTGGPPHCNSLDPWKVSVSFRLSPGYPPS